MMTPAHHSNSQPRHCHPWNLLSGTSRESCSHFVIWVMVSLQQPPFPTRNSVTDSKAHFRVYKLPALMVQNHLGTITAQPPGFVAHTGNETKHNRHQGTTQNIEMSPETHTLLLAVKSLNRAEERTSINPQRSCGCPWGVQGQAGRL